MIRKFRGFDIVGGKGWVYGDLTHNQKVTKTGLEPRTMVGGYEVSDESVGLFTGIKDDNGTEIYEGDIISVSFEGHYLFTATVKWYDNLGGFFMDEGQGCSSFIPQKGVCVVGNVYEQKDENKNT